MQGDEPVTFLHQRFFLHIVSPAVLDEFFCRLEQQPDSDFQLVFHPSQNLGRPQQDGDVGIMATGMHGTFILGFIGFRPQFCNGQSIDIRPDADDLVRRMRPLDGGNHTGLAGFHARDPQFPQILHNVFLGFKFLPRSFWMLVEMSPQGNQFFLDSIDLFLNIHCSTPPDQNGP